MQILLNKADFSHSTRNSNTTSGSKKDPENNDHHASFINDVIKATIIYKPVSNAQYILQRLQYAKESIGFEAPDITKLKMKAIGIKSTFQEVLRLFMPVYALYVTDKLVKNVQQRSENNQRESIVSNNTNKLLIFILSNIFSETLSRFPAEKFASIFVDPVKQTFSLPKVKQVIKNSGFWGTIAFIAGVFAIDKLSTPKSHISNQDSDQLKPKKEINSAFGIGALYFAGRIYGAVLYIYQQTRDSLSLIPKLPIYEKLRRGRALSVGIRSLGQDIARAAVPLASLAVMNSYFKNKKDQDNIKPWVYGGVLAGFDVIYRKLGKDIFSIFIKKTPITIEGKKTVIENIGVPHLKDIQTNGHFKKAFSITVLLSAFLGILKYKYSGNSPEQSTQIND